MYEDEFYNEEQPFTKVDKLTNDLLNAIRKEAEDSVDEENRFIREQNKNLKSQVKDLENQIKELKGSLNNSIINEELCDIGRIIMSKEYDMDKYDELFSFLFTPTYDKAFKRDNYAYFFVKYYNNKNDIYKILSKNKSIESKIAKITPENIILPQDWSKDKLIDFLKNFKETISYSNGQSSDWSNWDAVYSDISYGRNSSPSSDFCKSNKCRFPFSLFMRNPFITNDDVIELIANLISDEKNKYYSNFAVEFYKTFAKHFSENSEVLVKLFNNTHFSENFSKKDISDLATNPKVFPLLKSTKQYDIINHCGDYYIKYNILTNCELSKKVFSNLCYKVKNTKNTDITLLMLKLVEKYDFSDDEKHKYVDMIIGALNNKDA